MELTAAIEALRALKGACVVELHTDSEYLRNGITKWIHGWKRNGWRTADTKPVKNADLWQALEPETVLTRSTGAGCGAMPGITSTSAPTNLPGRGWRLSSGGVEPRPPRFRAGVLIEMSQAGGWVDNGDTFTACRGIRATKTA